MTEDYSIVWHGIAPDPWVFEASRTPGRRYQIGTSFYTSRHFCPNCGKHLFKASLNGKYSARLDDGTIMPVGRVYYCPNCHLLYTVPNERELKDGKGAVPDFNMIANLADDETDISYIYLVM